MGLPLFAAKIPSLLLLQWEMRGLGGLQRTDGILWRRRSVRLGVVTVEALDVVGDDERGRPRPPLGPRGRRGVAGVGAPRHALAASSARLSGRARGRTSCRGPVRLLGPRRRVDREISALAGRQNVLYGHNATPGCRLINIFGKSPHHIVSRGMVPEWYFLGEPLRRLAFRRKLRFLDRPRSAARAAAAPVFWFMIKYSRLRSRTSH